MGLHVDRCEVCRLTVEAQEEAEGRLLTGQEDVALQPGALENVLAKLDVLVASERVGNDVSPADGLSLPAPLESIGFLPAVYLSATTWVAHLDAPRFQGWRTYIFCCGPDTILPPHGHGGDELIVVVEGEFHDERDFGVGDFAENKPGMVHEMQSSPGGRFIALVSSAGPIEWRAEDQHLGELTDI